MRASTAVVGQVDVNVEVRPYVVSARVNVSAPLVFFALLGGVEAFGIVGIFGGSVIPSATLAVQGMLRIVNFSWQATPDGPQHVTFNVKPTE